MEAIQYFDKARKHPSSISGLSKKATNWLFMVVLLSENDIEASSMLNDVDNEADRMQLSMFQEEYNKIPFKSPSTAGAIAAVIPGAGHMYVGRYRDAFASFLLNSLFIWGIIESFKQDNVAVGATLSVFEIGWYGGNIYSAINSTHKYNRHLKNNFKLKFKIDAGLMSNSFKNTNKLFLVFNANF